MSDETDTKPEGENGDTPQQNPEGNVANRYFSIEVAPPPKAAEVPEGSDTEAYTYFRMGAPDDATEGTLPPNPTEPGTTGSATKSPWEDGLLLYTTGKYELVTPSSSETSSESLEIIKDVGGLYSATYSTVGAEPFLLANAVLGATEVSYKRLNELTALLGTSLTAIVGIEQTFWNGIYTHYGIGSCLDAVLGSRISLETGQEVKFELGRTGLHGGGTSEFSEEFNVFSAGHVRLSSDPANEVVLAGWATWRLRIILALSVLGAATAVLTTLGATVESAVVWGATKNDDDLKKTLLATQIELGTLMGVFTLIQAAIIIAAAITRQAEIPTAVASDLASTTAAILRLEDTGAGEQSYLTVGQRQIRFDSLNNLILTNGITSPVGAPTITLSAGGIQLKAGGNWITINSSGITINANRISCVAGASSLNLAAAGATLAGAQVMINAVDAATLATTAAANAFATAEAAAAEAAAIASIPKEIAETLLWAARTWD